VLFDVSDTVRPGTWYATLLKGVFNFSPRTSVLEGVAWLVYLAVTLTLFLRQVTRKPTRPAEPSQQTVRV
jgi:high-affinity iron transporter